MTSITIMQSIQSQLQAMTEKDVDRDTYIKIYNEIHKGLSKEAALRFKDLVSADNGSFWMEKDRMKRFMTEIKNLDNHSHSL